MNKKKNKERSMKKIMIKLVIKTIIIITITSMIFTCFSPYYVFEEDIPDILDLPKKEIEIETKTIIQSYVLKDPYQMEIYTFSNRTIEHFLKKTSKKFSVEWYERKKEWDKHGWYETPFDSAHNNIIKAVLSFSSDDPKRLPSIYDRMEKALRKEGSFYAFYYIPSRKYPSGKKNEFLPLHFCFILLNKDDHKLYIAYF